MHHEQNHLEAIGGRATPSGRTGPASSFHVGTSVSALSSIHDPAVAIAVWQRALPEGVGEALAAWAAASAVGSGFEGIVDPSRVDLSPTVAGLSDARARAWLISDATSLVDRFSSLAGSSACRSARCAMINADGSTATTCACAW